MSVTKRILPLLLLSALLSSCEQRATVSMPEVDASPSAIVRDQYRHLRMRSDAVANTLNRADLTWYLLTARYQFWLALLAKAEALQQAAPANTQLSYHSLDVELGWIEKQADTFTKYMALHRSAEYPAMRELAPKFAAADRQAARQLVTGNIGTGDVEGAAILGVLVKADKLREGVRGLDAIRNARAALDKLAPDPLQARMMTAILRRAERSVGETDGLDGEGEVFEALKHFAAAAVRFQVDQPASCSRLDVDGISKGWYLPVSALDANDDEIDYVTIGKNGHANASPHFYLVAPKAACQRIASQLKGQVLASKPAGVLGMRYLDGMPRFDLIGVD